MIGHNIVRLFEARKGNLDHRVKRDYVRNGIATILHKFFRNVTSPKAQALLVPSTLNTDSFYPFFHVLL